MPTAATLTFTNQKLEPAIHPHLAATIDVPFKVSQNIPKGTILAEKTSDGKWEAYADGGAGGVETARGIAVFDMQTDSAGNITLSGTASTDGGEHGEETPVAPVYVAGFFYTADLAGLDANGVADLAGKLVKGDLTTGILRL